MLASTRSGRSVAIPREPEDLEVLVRGCRQCEVPLTARGGGTSLAGQAVGAGVSVDTSKYLNRLLRVVPEERWAEVEPGLVVSHLNTALQAHGLMFAPIRPRPNMPAWAAL